LFKLKKIRFTKEKLYFKYFIINNVLNFNQFVSKLNVYDLNGKNVKSLIEVNSLNIEDLINGIYILRAEINGQQYNTKLIK